MADSRTGKKLEQDGETVGYSYAYLMDLAPPLGPIEYHIDIEASGMVDKEDVAEANTIADARASIFKDGVLNPPGEVTATAEPLCTGNPEL